MPGAQRTRADAVILSALAMEHRAVVGALSDVDLYARRDGQEQVATVAGLRTVAMCLAAMGNVGAAAGAQLAIDVWGPRHLLLVGIAAGAGDVASVKLGDVLVAETVVGYEPGKHHEGTLRRRPDVHRPAFALLASAKGVTAQEWVPLVTLARPQGGDGTPEVHFGTVLTGEKVLADSATFAELRLAWPTTVGVEMESLGVATAAHRSGIGFLLVKGVSDFADADKNDSWRNYAATAAARFAVAVLHRYAAAHDDSETDEDPRRPVQAATRVFALVPSGQRIAAVAGSLYRSRGADIWVNSENTDMEMSRTSEFTVSGVIRYWGARRDHIGRVTDDVIATELARRVGRRVPVAPGTAVVTGSGALADSHGVRHIIHVASVSGEPGVGFRQVRNIASCVTNALTEADRLARADPTLRTILFPLLGVGNGAGPLEATTMTMVDTIVEFFAWRPTTPLQEVQLLGFNAAEWHIVTTTLAAHRLLTPIGER